MTKTIALVLAASLFACAADQTEQAPAESEKKAPAATNSASPPSTSATDDETCPDESTGVAKTAGLLEKCAGDFECNGGRRYGGKEASLHSDGVNCRVAENPGDDLVLEADGRTVLDGKTVGSWSGDSVAFTFTHDYGSGPVEYRCRPIPSTAR